jgi:hypothetical protein
MARVMLLFAERPASTRRSMGNDRAPASSLGTRPVLSAMAGRVLLTTKRPELRLSETSLFVKALVGEVAAREIFLRALSCQGF